MATLQERYDFLISHLHVEGFSCQEADANLVMDSLYFTYNTADGWFEQLDDINKVIDLAMKSEQYAKDRGFYPFNKPPIE
jgi:hypothetical protein